MNTNIKQVASEEVVTAININGEKVNKFNLQQVLDGEVEFSDIVDKMVFYLACLDRNKEHMESEIYNLTDLEFSNALFYSVLTRQRLLQEVLKCADKKISDLEMLKLQRELTEEEKDMKLRFKNILKTTTDGLKDSQDKINCILEGYTTTFKFEDK